MKQFFRIFFASFLAIVFLLAAAGLGVKMKLGKKSKIKDHSYLVVDIYGNLPEYDPPGSGISSMLGGKPETLNRILNNLMKARVDKRIDGVILKVSMSNNGGMAAFQEIREAVRKVRAAGKPVYAFSDAMDRNALFLASSCDSIYMPSNGYFYFTGLSLTSEHLSGSLEKLGIKVNLHKIKDYKSAAEMVTRSDLSPESREMYGWILEEVWDMGMQAISQGRGLSEEKIVDCMRHALFSTEEARDAGLIDRVAFFQDLEDQLKQDKDDKPRFVTQSRYAKEKAEDLGFKGKQKIAVIHAQGIIGGRKSQVHPLLGTMMGHETVVADLNRARLDKDIKAVVFRVDSRGGEGLASGLIAHEVERLSKMKPVVVSMVDVAASGGYDIAYCANKLMADPATITGSIGSIAAKFNTRGLNDKLGITHDHVTKGPMALLYSSDRDFTREERTRFEQNHWEVFNVWFDDICKHRGMTPEQLDKLAQGRIWTGRQAKENGLIDELGGLEDAVGLAKTMADIPKDERVTVLHYPQTRGIISELFGGNGLSSAFRAVVYRLLQDEMLSMSALAPGETRLMDPLIIR